MALSQRRAVFPPLGSRSQESSRETWKEPKIISSTYQEGTSNCFQTPFLHFQHEANNTDLTEIRAPDTYSKYPARGRHIIIIKFI